MRFYKWCLKAARRFLRDERGDGGIEAVFVLPLCMLLFMGTATLAVLGWEKILAAAVVPMMARRASVGADASPGLTFLSDTSVQRSPAGCKRGVKAQLSTESTFKMPLSPEMTIHLGAGSYTYQWQFWGGPPDDACE